MKENLNEFLNSICFFKTSATSSPPECLMASHLNTPLGTMLAIGNEKLYLLEFTDRLHLKENLVRLSKKTGLSIQPGRSLSIDFLENELKSYFEGQLSTFLTPTCALGSPFQNSVWQQLKKIPYGQTTSYREIALFLNKPTAFRAVAQANANNPLTLIVPCHRVIYSNGTIGGYAGGVLKKEWLLKFEKNL